MLLRPLNKWVTLGIVQTSHHISCFLGLGHLFFLFTANLSDLKSVFVIRGLSLNSVEEWLNCKYEEVLNTSGDICLSMGMNHFQLLSVSLFY
jgi:hypothetical protein